MQYFEILYKDEADDISCVCDLYVVLIYEFLHLMKLRGCHYDFIIVKIVRLITSIF